MICLEELKFSLLVRSYSLCHFEFLNDIKLAYEMYNASSGLAEAIFRFFLQMFAKWKLHKANMDIENIRISSAIKHYHRGILKKYYSAFTAYFTYRRRKLAIKGKALHFESILKLRQFRVYLLSFNDIVPRYEQ